MAAKKTQDLSNNKQMVLGFLMYANDVDDGLPFCWGEHDNASPNWNWSPPFAVCVYPYIKNAQIFQSPVDNYSRGQFEPSGQTFCDSTKAARPRTFAENWSWPANDQWGWGSGSVQSQMSPFDDETGGNIGNVPAVATTILVGPRPNNYSQVCVGWATDLFFNYGEFTQNGGGERMFNNGTNYALCDGHAKFMTKSTTLKPQGSQVGKAMPAYWPNDPVNWPWPAGMWDKQQ